MMFTGEAPKPEGFKENAIMLGLIFGLFGLLFGSLIASSYITRHILHLPQEIATVTALIGPILLIMVLIYLTPMYLTQRG